MESARPFGAADWLYFRRNRPESRYCQYAAGPAAGGFDATDSPVFGPSDDRSRSTDKPCPAHLGEQPDPVGTLTGQPLPTASTPPLPPGSYPSPFYTDGPGCCGPMGRDGRVGYEIYTYTGPTWAIGEGEFTRRLQTGWMVGGGGRGLFFDQSHSRAWVIDLGLSYQYNRGEFDDPISTDVRQIPLRNPVTGQTTTRPDILTRVRIRALDRTNFNYGVGRDWWLSGAATPGLEDHVNWRIGTEVGGRWGTAHIDLVPLNDPSGYARRHNVTHGVFVAAHSTVEVPMGSWILFAGLRPSGVTTGPTSFRPWTATSTTST